MQKVKIFSFRAVDCSYNANVPHRESSFSEIQMNRAAAENVINDFIKDKQVISITPSISTVRHHNNGGYDTENIIYTIVYEEESEKWYAVTRWCTEDVIAAAEQQGLTLTEEQAAKWWKKNERSFSEMLVEDGNERLSYMNFEEENDSGER